MWPNPTNPRPANLPEPTWWEVLLPDWMVSGIQTILAWGEAHLLWIMAILLIVLVLKFWLDRKRRRQKEIERLWLFVLFFLSKRLMMIPLVVTLGDRQGEFKKSERRTLLTLRQKCRTLPLRQSPEKRMVEELKISQLLFAYFSTLEKTGKITKGSKFERVIQDLEFIDQKLVSLQKMYNIHVQDWNHNLNGVLKLFGFRPFEPFRA